MRRGFFGSGASAEMGKRIGAAAVEGKMSQDTNALAILSSPPRSCRESAYVLRVNARRFVFHLAPFAPSLDMPLCSVIRVERIPDHEARDTCNSDSGASSSFTSASHTEGPASLRSHAMDDDTVNPGLAPTPTALTRTGEFPGRRSCAPSRVARFAT